MLDYDESSVIITYDQTSGKKEVFKGVEVVMLSELFRLQSYTWETMLGGNPC